MDSRKLACVLAAGFLSVTFVGVATNASAKPRDVVIVAQKIDPELQRRVSYRDLNLSVRPDQKILNRRIWLTATDLCLDLNADAGDIGSCTSFAIHSTDDQVTAAIDRAQRKMAGLPVGPAVAISMAMSAR